MNTRRIIVEVRTPNQYSNALIQPGHLDRLRTQCFKCLIHLVPKSQVSFMLTRNCRNMVTDGSRHAYLRINYLPQNTQVALPVLQRCDRSQPPWACLMRCACLNVMKQHKSYLRI
jgi:hypothetical protein